MLRRSVSLGDAVSRLDEEDLGVFLLADSTERRIDTLVQNLAKLNEVVLKLQLNNCTLRHARAYLDSVLDVYPTLEARLCLDARIVHTPIFEHAILMIQDEREEDLVASERRAVKCLLLFDSSGWRLPTPVVAP